MSKLAHSNEETMAIIERDNSDPDEWTLVVKLDYLRDCIKRMAKEPMSPVEDAHNAVIFDLIKVVREIAATPTRPPQVGTSAEGDTTLTPSYMKELDLVSDVNGGGSD